MSTPDNQAQEIFLEAIEQHAPDRRTEFIELACGGNVELRARVEQLLRSHEQLGSFHDDARLTNATIGQSIAETRGTQIGPYKLLQKIGEGGMGVVFMAEQKEPIKRRVALKIIKPGMDTHDVIARFEAERQALAMMDHPNIAKVLDAGATDSGRPYFVMELVNGIAVTQYSDGQHLTPKERLELFVPICQAVQHAHQKGIIHRDLKPTNILVALYDGQPVPKVIDFGVAKATSQNLTEKTMFTQLGQLVGTLEYMSPEQAQRNQLDIDTRSDIYSLGVLLYELLTGDTPFDPERLRSVAFDEMLRIIRDEEPPKPSTKLSSSAGLPSIAANRKTDPAKLSLLVRGELDWIVMKALEKDRSRRYGTANDFANDVRRHLDDEPVEACPPSARYRLRKFILRNRAAFATGSIFVVTLLIGLVGTASQAVRATRLSGLATSAKTLAEQRYENEKQARALSQKNMTLAYQTLDRIYLRLVEEELPKHPDRLTNYRRVLQDALDFYGEFSKMNAASPTARVELAVAYGRSGVLAKTLGANDDALHRLRDAGEMFRNLSHEEPSELGYREKLADINLNMGTIHELLGRFDQALDAYRTALDIGESFEVPYPNLVEHHDNLAVLFQNLGRLYQTTGRLNDAEDCFRRSVNHALILEDSSTAPHHRNRVASCLIDLGMRLVEKGELDAGDHHYGHALRLLRRLTVEHPDVAAYDMVLATCLLNRSRLMRLRQQKQAAKESAKDAVLIAERLVRDYPLVPEYRSLLGRIYANVTYLAEPLNILDDPSIFERAIDLARQQVEEHPNVPSYSFDLVLVYNNQGVDLELTDQWKDAMAMYQKGDAIAKELASSFPQVAQYRIVRVRLLGNLADVRNKLDLLSEAEATYQQAIEHSRILAESFSGEVGIQLLVADIEARFAMFLRGQKRAEQAMGVWRSVIQRLSTLGRSAPSLNSVWMDLAKAHLNHGNLLFDTGQFEEAKKSFDQAETGLRAIDIATQDSALVREGLAHVSVCRGDLYASMARNDDAEDAYRQAIVVQGALATDHPDNFEMASKLAMILEKLSMFLYGLDRLQDSELEARRAVEVCEPLVARYEDRRTFRDRLFNLVNMVGVISGQQEHHQDAEQAFLRAAQLAEELHEQFPQHAAYETYPLRVWNNIVAVTQQSGNDTLKTRALERLLFYEPNNAQVLNEMAWLMATSDDLKLRDASKAVELATRAVGIDANDADYVATLGAAQYRLGNWHAAVDRLTQALDRRGDDAVAGAYDYFYLAMAQSRLGHTLEAQRSFERGNKLLQQLSDEDTRREPLLRLQNEASKQLSEDSNDGSLIEQTKQLRHAPIRKQLTNASEIHHMTFMFREQTI